MAHRRRQPPPRPDVNRPASRPGNPWPIVLDLCASRLHTAILKLRRSGAALTESRLSTPDGG
jgi:hypothetical protein